MAATHGAPQRAPLLTPTEARLIEAGMARGPRIIAQALSDGEAATLAAETRAAIRDHRRECDDMKWSDIDREHVQPLEGRITAHLVPIGFGRALPPIDPANPNQLRTSGGTRPRSPFARPRRMRPFVEPLAWLGLLIGCAGVLLLGTAVLRAAWQVWGGAR